MILLIMLKNKIPACADESEEETLLFCKGGALSYGSCSQLPFTSEAQNARWR